MGKVIPLSLSTETAGVIEDVSSTLYFNGNKSSFAEYLIRTLKDNKYKIPLSDGKQMTIDELIDLSKDRYYDFTDIKVNRRSTPTAFKEDFNTISNPLKSRLYKFIQVFMEHLYRYESRGLGSISCVKNISLYNADGYHMLYININLQYPKSSPVKPNKVRISKYMQENMLQYQPQTNNYWRSICLTLGKPEDSDIIDIDVQQVNKLIEAFER